MVITRRAFGIGSAALLGSVSIAQAQAPAALTEVVIAATPAAPDCIIAVAIEQGMFTRAGVDAKLTMVPLMPNVPAAILSGSTQLGFITTPTFLQAVDGGLDLVAICGGQVTNDKIDDGAILTRPDITIAKPSDLIGKSVGVPGLNAFFHVVLRYWLMERGVDPAQVKFVEVTFPSMGDVLRGKSVDAVLAIEPFYSSIVASGAGKVAVRVLMEIPSDKLEVFFVSTRDWATAHRQEVIAIRAAITEAEATVNKDRDLAIRELVKYVKLPPAVLPHVSLGTYDPKIDAAGLNWWVEVMTRQNMLTSKLDVPKLIWS